MKASLVVDYHLNNKIFDLTDTNVNRDNCVYSNWLLKKALHRCGITLSTCDINSPLDSKVVICFDMPAENVKVDYEFSYLFLFECEVIKPKSWNIENHRKFNKVFTWNDDLVDNEKYFKMNFAHKFPECKAEYRSKQKRFSDKKLCALISGNKKVSHELELYSERVKTIRWFDSNTAHDFDLYGVGWKQYTSENKYIRFLISKLPRISKIIAPNFPSYKGKVGSKFETLSNYKFAICYENAQGITGYITEKIFDCFFAGCVPIYWGAPNVTEHIPENCFIDRREFKTHEDLYFYINNMTEKEYLEIQRNIENYIFSKKADPYRAEIFANTIVNHICDDLSLS